MSRDNKKVDVISKERLNEITSLFTLDKKILVLGDIGIDKYTFGEVSRISPEAPVPVLEVTKEWNKLGLAANISDNLKALNMNSLLCGVMGEDRHAQLMEELLEEKDLSTWGLVRDESRPTTFKERVTTSGQQICRIDYERARPLTQEIEKKLLDRVAEFLPDCQAVIIEDYAKGVLGRDLITQVRQLAHQQNKMLAIDPGVSTPAEFYRGVDLLKPNLKEAKIMAQSLGLEEQKAQDVSELCRFLVNKLDLAKIVITLGAEGMAMHEKDGEVELIPTLANEVFDVSGAGDTSMALLVASLINGASLKEAAWVSNCGAGVVVAKKGTATVSIKELHDFHRRVVESFST